jgi:hypothetical protein
MTAMLIVAALVRSMLLSERLAVLELAVPGALLWVRLWMLRPDSMTAARRRALNAAPFAGLVLVIVLFGVGEYFRSWSTHYSKYEDSLPVFVTVRLTGYYVLSINNGPIAFDESDYLPRLPRFLLDFFWTFPGVSGAYEDVTGDEPTEMLGAARDRMVNPEFNSPCGLFLPAFDLGLILAPAFWLYAGAFTQSLYRGFMQGTIVGLCFYPLVCLSMLELPRIFYITGGRVFPSIGLIAGTLVVLRLRRRGTWPA